ncbi:MAG: hypothetical protein HY962_01570 [Ignavibacteriae bacterium]|nr:hypothetical protein [Ignavibacteriota bacterium]
MDRRTFIKATGGLAAMAGLPAADLLAENSGVEEGTGRMMTVGVFREKDFPSPDGDAPDDSVIDAALKSARVLHLDARALESVDTAGIDILITPYGSAFPLDAMDAMLRYLRAGGNWVNLRGVPLSRPVTRAGDRWILHDTQPAGYRPLGISHFHEVPHPPMAKWMQEGPVRFEPEAFLDPYAPSSTFALYIKLTTKKSFPEEDGSDGPREAVLQPVLRMIDADARIISAPVLLIDRLEGPYAGGRWVFDASRGGSLGTSMIRAMTALASTGALDLRVTVSDACPRPGDMVHVSADVLRRKSHPAVAITQLTVGHTAPGRAFSELHMPEGGMDIQVPPLERPGRTSLHHVSADATITTPFGTFTQQHRQGFVAFDALVFTRGRDITVDGDHFRYDGAITPIIGTTHMASDVHRRYLLEPNPAIWEKDFSAMDDAGITMVRNGIWTGWALHSDADGTPKESVLRALEAYYLTARATRVGMPVIFTFFAFLPESWGGVNPFLDPKALEAQERFVGGFARRFTDAKEILWDFINEPSFSSAKHLWSVRPNGDEHERAAWIEWLRASFPTAKTDRELRNICATTFRVSPARALDLPVPEDFQEMNLHGDRSPRKAAAYRFFAQAMFTRWAARLRDVVKREAGPQHLVTVGQDEGGAYDRPAPQFHAGVVDFTCLHNWWSNDDLLWDGIVTKVPGVTHLVEETGVMMYETRDGLPWRSEDEAAALLDRKCAYSFAAGGAGFIEWAWNTNPYMDSDNEAAIGLHRADGTAKPELEVIKKYWRLYGDRGRMMEKPAAPRVALVLPHTHMFQTRNLASDATKRAVRALEYHCRVRIHAVTEFAIERLPSDTALLVIPAPLFLSDAAWTQIVARIRTGAIVYLSGAFERNEHGEVVRERLAMVNTLYDTRPVAAEETLKIGDQTIRFGFRGERLQRVEKALTSADAGAQASAFSILPVTKELAGGATTTGRLLWTGLPIECSDDIESIAAVYRHVLRAARLTPEFTVTPDMPGIFVRRITYAQNVCYIAVSETSANLEVRITDHTTAKTINMLLPAGRTAVEWL